MTIGRAVVEDAKSLYERFKPGPFGEDFELSLACFADLMLEHITNSGEVVVVRQYDVFSGTDPKLKPCVACRTPHPNGSACPKELALVKAELAAVKAQLAAAPIVIHEDAEKGR